MTNSLCNKSSININLQNSSQSDFNIAKQQLNIHPITSSNINNIQQSIRHTQRILHSYEYELFTIARKSKQHSIINKLYQPDLVSGSYLYQQQEQLIKVQAPSIFIQKIRTLYFSLFYFGMLLQQQQYERLFKQKGCSKKIKSIIMDVPNQNKQVFKRAYLVMKLKLYKSQRIGRRQKMYLAQFCSFINLDQSKIFQNYNDNKHIDDQIKSILINNLNKYPIMDQILIQLFLHDFKLDPSMTFHFNNLSTIDDNYNIATILQTQLGLHCEFKMFRQFIIDDCIEVTLVSDGFYILPYTHFIQRITNIIKKQSDNCEIERELYLLDVSRIKQYATDVFDQADQSFINQLEGIAQDDKQIQKHQEKVNNTNKIKPISPLIPNKQHIQLDSTLQKQKRAQINNFISFKSQQMAEYRKVQYKREPEYRKVQYKREPEYRKVQYKREPSRSLIKIPANFSIRQISTKSTNQMQSPNLKQNKIKISFIPSNRSNRQQNQPRFEQFSANMSVKSIQFNPQQNQINKAAINMVQTVNINKRSCILQQKYQKNHKNSSLLEQTSPKHINFHVQNMKPITPIIQQKHYSTITSSTTNKNPYYQNNRQYLGIPSSHQNRNPQKNTSKTKFSYQTCKQLRPSFNSITKNTSPRQRLTINSQIIQNRQPINIHNHRNAFHPLFNNQKTDIYKSRQITSRIEYSQTNVDPKSRHVVGQNIINIDTQNQYVPISVRPPIYKKPSHPYKTMQVQKV